MPSLLVIAALVLFALGAGYAVNLLWLRAGTTNNRNTLGPPTCGKCGYIVHGISTFNCPECGADLREVGIRKPGDQNSVALGCLLIPGFSIVLCIIAFVLYAYLAEQVLPIRHYAEDTMMLLPNSSEFGEPGLNIHYSETVPSGSHSAIGGLSTTQHYSGPAGSSTTVEFFTLNAPANTLNWPASNTEIHRIYLELYPKQSVTFNWFPSIVEIAPATGGVTWTDKQGKIHPTNKSFTDQDMLAVLKDLGADTTRPEVLVEAQELHGMLDAFATGKPQFTLTTMNSTGSSSSSSYGVSPPWFTPVYVMSAIALWILSIILITRRLRKGIRRKPEQN